MTARGCSLKVWGAFATLALLGASGCLDPIVGAECKAGYSPCRGACVVSGRCIDASALDGGILDGAESEVSEGIDATGETSSLDGEPSAAIDSDEIDQSELDGDEIDQAPDSPPEDLARGDNRPGDIAVDKPLPPADVPMVDTADAPRSPDTMEVKDAAVGEPPDAPQSPDATETKDAPPLADLPPQDAPLPQDVRQDAIPNLVVDTGEALDTTRLDAQAIDLGCDTCSDAGSGEAGLFDGSDIDGAVADRGDVADDVAADAPPDGPLVCGTQEIICENRCVDPARNPNHCGGCGRTCDAGVCNQGTCLVCADDERVCSGRCVKVATDRDNCGKCNNPCTNGLCSNGQCQAAGTGRVIVIGHDYLENREDMNRILGNAVFLWPKSPVKLLAYTVWANPTAILGVKAAIDQIADDSGRQYTLTLAQDESAPGIALALDTADVFLIYGQESANNDTLSRLGTTWKAALSWFVQEKGGTLIVLDGYYASNLGTVQLLTQTASDGKPKIFDLARDISTTGGVCTVTSPGHALAVGLPARMYFCERNSTSFLVNDEATTITEVVADDGHTVVLDKIF
jgi:hypothetical protein